MASSKPSTREGPRVADAQRHLRRTYDEMDLNAIERAVGDLDRPDVAGI